MGRQSRAGQVLLRGSSRQRISEIFDLGASLFVLALHVCGLHTGGVIERYHLYRSENRLRVVLGGLTGAQ